MLKKPCPNCGRPTITPQFWLPHKWRGGPCPDCGTNIGLPAASAGAALLFLPLAPVADSDAVSLPIKIMLFGGLFALVVLYELRTPLVVRRDRKP